MLSGGEQRRALVSGSELIPAGNLDSGNGGNIIGILKELGAHIGAVRGCGNARSQRGLPGRRGAAHARRKTGTAGIRKKQGNLNDRCGFHLIKLIAVSVL